MYIGTSFIPKLISKVFRSIYEVYQSKKRIKDWHIYENSADYGLGLNVFKKLCSYLSNCLLLFSAYHGNLK